jgi:FAD/FMN-containing dehydrogenase
VVGTGDLESDTIKKIENSVYEPLEFIGGSFSAEHGIGQLKKNNLKTHKNDVAYSLMKIIKNQLDPKGIMNPGKVLF